MCGFVRSEQCAPAVAGSANASERMPVMYAISSDNGRRASQTAPQRPELPILFHLIDVSRPRAAAKETSPERAAEPAKAVEIFSPLSVPPPVAASATLLAAAVEKAVPGSTSVAVSLEAVAAEVIEPQTESIGNTPKSAPNCATANSGTSSSDTAQKHAPPTAAEQPVLLKVAEPASPTTATVTLKPKTGDRRQRKTPASEDWFASHGKFIAIGFVVALIGTVYFARTNRQQVEPAKTEAAAQSPLAEHSSVEISVPSPSKSVQMVAAVSDSQVELQPPSAPPLIASTPNTDKAAGNDRLFDFPATAKAEQRVAAKPAISGRELKSDPSPAASEPAAGAPAVAPAYPVTTSPAAYPQTSAPVLPSAPALQGPANAAPSYRSQFPSQPPSQPGAPQPSQPQSGWTPPPSGPGASQYQPMNNTARGPRYEFTGSGRY
jgi:hypothetical protein